MNVPRPLNEPERLKALHDLKILDTPAEQAFDDITHLASFICEVPIALITLIDGERQWYKSAIGIDGRETPRDVAFCAHAICEPDRILEVHDARADARFAQNPNVIQDPHIRFYAGAPLVTDGGYALGTLCVIDRVPRALTPRQKEALSALRRRVVAELALRRANERLEELSRELADMNETLRSLHDEKNRMLGMAAHDLRNPISVIAAYSDLLREDGGDRMSPHDRRGMLDVISSTSRQMLTIVNDFLDLSKIEAGVIELRLEPTKLSPLVGRIVGLNQILAGRKRIDLVVHDEAGDSEAVVDPGKLEQVLNNLLTNAVKFSAEGSTVDVAITTEAGRACLRVRDRGRGIKPELLEHVFTPFGRAQSKGTAGETGSGLGLAIVRRIVEAHGGTIDVESSPGNGTTFTVRLPLQSR